MPRRPSLPSKNVNLRMPEDLLKQMDCLAQTRQHGRTSEINCACRYWIETGGRAKEDSAKEDTIPMKEITLNPEFKQLIIIAVVLAALFFIGPAAADTAAFSVKINGDANVVNGEYYTFTAEVTPADSNVSIVWSSENPAVANGSSLLLPESSGFETYVKDIDYNYSDDGFLSLSEDRKSMPANEETFVFRSDYCLGDVNQDGNVSAADATVICSRLLDEKPDWTPEEVFYGKISGDANVPVVLDALTIAKYAVGLVDADYKPVINA